MIPKVPFYFVRHGQTDWNKNHQALCNQDDIPLNQTGFAQAADACKQISLLGITKIYSSPLTRAKQTAEIINEHLKLSLELNEGLREILPEWIIIAFAEILDPSHTILVVSHGEVYRILLRILSARASCANAKNCGLYLFSPPDLNSNQWIVNELED